MSDRKRIFQFSVGLIAGFVVASFSTNYKSLLNSYTRRETYIDNYVLNEINITTPKGNSTNHHIFNEYTYDTNLTKLQMECLVYYDTYDICTWPPVVFGQLVCLGCEK